MSPEDMAQRLSLLEARLALSERTAGMGTFRYPIAGGASFWSPGLFRILGLDPIGPAIPFLNTLHPDDRPALIEATRSVISAPGPFYLRCRILRPEGDTRHIEMSGDVETDETGELVALVGVISDVTPRIEAEEQLRGAMDAFRVLTEEANDLICRHGPDMNVVYCSPASIRLLGYDPIDMLGEGFIKLFHPGDIPTLRTTHASLMTPGAAQTVTVRLRQKSGDEIWAEVVCRSVGDPETGSVHEIITVSRDVTARKAAEIEIEKARETAESANRTKSRFLATMSHELRTPLNAIIGFSDMIRSELFGELPARYKEYTELIHESGTLLLDLINDILDMSKIEAGRFDLSMESANVADITASCGRLMSNKAERSGLELAIETDSQATAEVDKRAVKQILLNLLSNAIKFTPRGGKVTLSARDYGQHVALIVADTGVGIPAKDLPRLGQPFEQASQEANLSKTGTGLGLALVRSLASLHGGDMAIRSREKQGTTVTVLLPKIHRGAEAAA